MSLSNPAPAASGERRRSSVVQVARNEDGVLRVTDAALRRVSLANTGVFDEYAHAKEAAATELNLTIPQAIKLYKKGIAFSLLFSLAVIMEGYDLALMGSFYEFPEFRRMYGTETNAEGEPIISAAWQSGLSNGVQVGSIIGLYLNGWISEKIGYKKTMLGSLVLMIAFIFIPVFSQNVETLLAGAILMGIPWGVFQTLTTTYASEVTPTNLRCYLTTYVNLCWVIGQLIAAGVLRGFLQRTDEWAFRIPFMLQWVWPVPILIGTIFAPESPWWLVRHGRYEDAKKAILKIVDVSSGIPFDVDAQVKMIKATDELERAIAEGTSYVQCFRGIDRRRTEIVSMAWVTQAFCGAALMGFSVQFYARAGLDTAHSFDMNIGQYGMGVVGTLLSWWLMTYVGRRKIYIWGLGVMFVLLVIVGGLGIPVNNAGASWGVGSLLLVYTFIYDFTVGPVCYSIVAEIPSTRLKVKSVVLARNFYNMGGIINNILMPRMIGVNEWNWGAKTGFFWAGACALLFTWCFFRLPEPKDRTYGELDVLFEHKVSARKFHKTKVDQFAGEHTEVAPADSDSASDAEKATVEHKAHV